MTWLGMKTDITPVADVPGAAELASNVRLQKAGELQRRYGFLSSSLPKQTTAIRLLMSSNTTHGGFVATVNEDGSVSGFSTVGGVGLLPTPPRGKKIQPPRSDPPQPPVIISASAGFEICNPGHPEPPYPLVADVQYDGLSGALTYQWQATFANDDQSETLDVMATAEEIAFFDTGLDNEVYYGQLVVSTEFNGFSDSVIAEIAFTCGD